MPETLDDPAWKLLIDRINDGRCTPFLGAGMCYGVLPLGGDVAQTWAREYNYPLDDAPDLARVSQFTALDRQDAAFPKETILRMFEGKSPDFGDQYEPHRLLAGLPLPLYLTTNYDGFMFEALKRRRKDPKRDTCRWNNYTKQYPSIFETAPGYEPTPANPLVFHLHGYDQLSDSLVLTEDDYLDFIVNLWNDPALLPPVIKRALSGTTLLFIGYRIADLNLRAILRAASRTMERGGRRTHFATMLLPAVAADAARQEAAQKFLNKYYGNLDVRVYWGTAREFLRELWERWEASAQGR